MKPVTDGYLVGGGTKRHVVSDRYLGITLCGRQGILTLTTYRPNCAACLRRTKGN